MESNDIEEEEFGFSRNYFLAKELRNSGKKSARKLSDFNLVDEQELREAYANIDQKHEKEISNLIHSYKDSYKEWVFVLRCGFGLLMHGFGSKKALIEDFASTALGDYSVLVINGYLQPINLKQYGTRKWFALNSIGIGYMFLPMHPTRLKECSSL